MIVQISGSFNLPPQAGMPVQRIPFLIFQKVQPGGSSSTPSDANCGGAGYSPRAMGWTGIALGRAVANDAVQRVKLDPLNKIVFGQLTGLRLLRRWRGKGCAPRVPRDPIFQQKGFGLSRGSGDENLSHNKPNADWWRRQSSPQVPNETLPHGVTVCKFAQVNVWSRKLVRRNCCWR